MKYRQKLSVAILAGGMGTRLKAVVPDRPKALVSVCNRPFITYLLDQLIAAKVDTVVICVGYLGSQIKDYLGCSYRSIRIEYSHESEPLGTAGALRLALPLLESNTIMVLNGDSYIEAALDGFYRWHSENRYSCSMLLAKVPNVNRYGQVCVGNDGKITNFEEKKDVEEPGWINAGVYLLAHDLVFSIPTYRFVSLENDIFPELIYEGLYGYKSKSRFIDIGTPSSFLQSQEFFNTTTDHLSRCG